MLKPKLVFFYLALILNLSNKICGNAIQTDFYIIKQTKCDETVGNCRELQNVIENLRSDLNATHEKCTPSIIENKTCQLRGIPSNCGDATACTQRSGYYGIKPHLHNSTPFIVECDVEADGGTGAWMVIQRRIDGSVDFHRNWKEYQNGFGNVDGEFFIGLEKLYALTNFDGPQELLVQLEKTDMTKSYAKYSAFKIGNESEKYVLKSVGNYEGTAGDSLKKRHEGYKFSTRDADNDSWTRNCAQEFIGGWWYSDCHDSNLNGHYGDVGYGKGINWLTITGYTSSLKSVKMMIRRRKY